MSPVVTVRPVNVCDEANWSFYSSEPTWFPGPRSGGMTFDPFPAYPHDIATAQAAADICAAACPPRWNVDVCVADRELACRLDGSPAIRWSGHNDDDGDWVTGEPSGLIMLSGKRMPPHPATTRYLVADGYGHNVEWMLAAARGSDEPHDETLMAGYAAMRGLPAGSLHFASGGRTHDAAAEVFASDFRLLVCGIEPEFWPHPGVDRPGPAVAEWWAAAVADLQA